MPEHEPNEFEDEINEIIEKRKTIFCPIINSMCRIDCEAFEMPSVEVVRDAPVRENLPILPIYYKMTGGVCTHFLLRKRDSVKVDYTW